MQPLAFCTIHFACSAAFLRSLMKDMMFLMCLFFHFSLFISNYGFIEEDNPSEKVATVEEELNCDNIDEILQKLLRFGRGVWESQRSQ